MYKKYFILLFGISIFCTKEPQSFMQKIDYFSWNGWATNMFINPFQAPQTKALTPKQEFFQELMLKDGPFVAKCRKNVETSCEHALSYFFRQQYVNSQVEEFFELKEKALAQSTSVTNTTTHTEQLIASMNAIDPTFAEKRFNVQKMLCDLYANRFCHDIYF